MALFKCKMCGGALEINNNETVATCEYCGTQQTLPKLDDDRRANLYDRANHFRRNNEFDKAMGIYEQILNEDNTDAEAYWSLVLCRYGIEYVEDPTSHKRVPTVNRAQFTSVFDDDNYKSALQYADGYQRSIYEEEAKAINEIQKGILAISQKEEPFDVFICYKETDNNGRRTPDSVLANDLYHQLTQEGFKVFFARITLEDKLGSAYEPYIFAALNSSKVMVALGTKPEYFNAVWVKNEWSRYLALIKQGQKKMLIPAYKDMDPYDLPEEFSHLQAQDMSKLGFMQDLIRGIKKIVQAETPKETTVVKETVVTGGNTNTAPLLERVFMFLEDRDWNSAKEYCEKVLDIDPKCAEAYLAKLMAELRVEKQEELKDCEEPFDEYNNYQKVLRFGNEKLKAELAGYIDYINARNENERVEGIYQDAAEVMEEAENEGDYKKAARLFESICDYQDSAALAQSCHEKAEDARKDAILSEGKGKMAGEIISNYESAIKLFATISGWKDADEQVIICQRKIEEIKAKEEAERLEKERQAQIERKEAERITKLNKKITIITIIVFMIVASIIIWSSVNNMPGIKYNDAIALMDAGKYEAAISAFEALGSFRDSATKITECNTAILDRKYNNAIALMDAEKYEAAIYAFESLDGYEDSATKITECKTAILDGKYNEAIALMNAEKYTEAISAFEALDGYKDSGAKLKECKYNNAIALMDAGNIVEAYKAFVALDGYKDSGAKLKECKYNNAIALMDAGKYVGAISAFEELDGYKDSATKITECKTAILDGKYNEAIALMNAEKYAEAAYYFETFVEGYKDSDAKLKECKYNIAIALMDAGNIVEAYEALVALDGYKDSADKANSIYDKYKVEKLKVAKAGDYVFFGAYEQDNNKSNGQEDIEWLVLAKERTRILVISKYALDCKPYNTSYTKFTWETCTLRKWLNNDFINAAFSVDEKAMIPTVTVSADKNPNYSTNPGNATQDQVFLLSITEANKYFSSDSARQCKPTDYAVASGAYVAGFSGNCGWGLRTPGGSQYYATVVYTSGGVNEYGGGVDRDDNEVRPAMWIDLNI